MTRCPTCNDSGLVRLRPGAVAVCRCGILARTRPPGRPDWMQAMGVDEYLTTGGVREHRPSFLEAREQVARIGARQS